MATAGNDVYSSTNIRNIMYAKQRLTYICTSQFLFVECIKQHFSRDEFFHSSFLQQLFHCTTTVSEQMLQKNPSQKKNYTHLWQFLYEQRHHILKTRSVFQGSVIGKDEKKEQIYNICRYSGIKITQIAQFANDTRCSKVILIMITTMTFILYHFKKI